MGSTKSKQLPQIVLFGDSLTQYAFEEEDQGSGWYLQDWYKGKVEIVNEGEFFQAVFIKTRGNANMGLGYAGYIIHLPQNTRNAYHEPVLT